MVGGSRTNPAGGESACLTTMSDVYLHFFCLPYGSKWFIVF